MEIYHSGGRALPALPEQDPKGEQSNQRRSHLADLETDRSGRQGQASIPQLSLGREGFSRVGCGGIKGLHHPPSPRIQSADDGAVKAAVCSPRHQNCASEKQSRCSHSQKGNSPRVYRLNLAHQARPLLPERHGRHPSVTFASEGAKCV